MIALLIVLALLLVLAVAETLRSAREVDRLSGDRKCLEGDVFALKAGRERLAAERDALRKDLDIARAELAAAREEAAACGQALTSLREEYDQTVAAWKAAHADLQARADRFELQLAADRKVYADSPDDRLYHAADQTWWRREADGRLVTADPPAEVLALGEQLRKAEAAGANWAVKARHHADVLNRVKALVDLP